MGVEFYVYDQVQDLLSSSIGTETYKYVCSTTGVNYIKVVRDGGTLTGDYIFRILPAYWNGDVVATWDSENEPNPYDFNAKLLQINQSISQHINYSGDEDWFRYTASEGTQYSVSLQEPSGLGVELYVYDHLLNLLSSDYGANTYSYTCNYDGTHYVKVVRDGGTVTGSYQLLLQATSPTYATDIAPSFAILHVGDSTYKLAAWSSQSTGIIWSSGNNSIASVDASGWVTAHSLGTVKIRATSANDPARYAESTVFVNPTGDHEGNDTFASAVLVPVNQKVASRIGTSSDNDYFKFNAVSGYGYTVIMETEPRVGVEFYVYDQVQDLLSSSIGTEAYKYICSTTGVNYIKVVRDGGTLTGDYIFRILPAYWNGDVVATWDSENEPNPNEYHARWLSVNSQSYNHVNYDGDLDYFRFQATAGYQYSVSLPQELGVGVELFVYNTGMTLLSSSNGTNSFNFTCAASGWHYVRVVRDGGTITGGYVLALSCADEPVTPPAPPSYNAVAGIGGDCVLSWDPVVLDANGNPAVVTSYIIQASDNPYTGFVNIGTTTTPQFTDGSGVQNYRFYRIIAVVE